MNAQQRHDKVVQILKGIERFTKAEDDELRELLKDFPEVERLVNASNAFEKKLSKMLKDEQKMFIEAVQMYLQDTSADNILVGAMLEMTMGDMFALSTFANSLSTEARAFLTKTVTELTTAIMNALDPDVPFQIFSKRTTDWIESWSGELGRIMHLTNTSAVEKAILETLREGDSIQTLVLKLQELPEFDRKRARATAITETLTASSVAQHESYHQSPSVVGKTWRHSGGAKIAPRPHHVALSGTTIPLDQQFEVGGEYADYPRDTNLSAGERVHCHCVLGPAIDEDILGLSEHERNLIREMALQEM